MPPLNVEARESSPRQPLPPRSPAHSSSSSPHAKSNSTTTKSRNGGILRRLSGSLVRSSSPSKKKGDDKAEKKVEDDVMVVDHDPVMALFEARSTQRVRFSIEHMDKSRKTTEPAKKKAEPKEENNNNSPQFNIKSFMRKTLFRTNSRESQKDDGEVAEALRTEDLPIVWENNELDVTPEVVHTSHSQKKGFLKLSFTENAEVRAKAVKLLDKARRAQFVHYRYEYAVKCNMKALELLTEAKYPDDHPLFVKTLQTLHGAHHALSSFNNSANIVKMGIRHEDNGELVRALKMYTIAYRIRRDQLSRTHPSLVVILNMLGSTQVKRGELHEAMQIYHLALRDAPVLFSKDREKSSRTTPTNLLAKAVTYREMGSVYERWGDDQKALQMFHRSLECVCEWRQHAGKYFSRGNETDESVEDTGPLCSLDNVQLTRSLASSDGGNDSGEMEVFINFPHQQMGIRGDASTTEFYNSFFSGVGTGRLSNRQKKSRDGYADVDVALTLHQIAQMHRRQGQYGRALDAYHASIRGMKHALGHYHPNVAAILGNIGNLQKETGDLDAAFDTYQEVLRLESYRLGHSHPEVAISLHNVATIEAARGKYDSALTIYQKVSALQKMLFGNDDPSLAVTLACMGDVHERLGNLTSAIDCYEKALKVKSGLLGRHHLEVARMIHKLGKMSCAHEEFNLAESYISRAILIYRLNRLQEDHEWLVDAHRDKADIDAAIAVGDGQFFEC